MQTPAYLTPTAHTLKSSGRQITLRPLTGMELMRLGTPDDKDLTKLADYAMKYVLLACDQDDSIQQQTVEQMSITELNEIQTIISNISGIPRQGEEDQGKSLES